VTNKLQESVSVLDFGAVGDGTTDDTAAIQAAITAAGAKTLFFPAGTYLIKSTLTQPQSQAWIGSGGQRATTLLKGFNGDLMVMQGLTRIEDINLSCQGSTYSGRGIYVSTSFSQQIHRVRIDQSQGISLEFATNVGGGACVTDFEATTSNPTVVPAIKWADTTASPKFFKNLWISGGLIDFSGGGNGCTIDGFYIRNFVTSSTSVLCHISNGRVASLSDTTTLSGADCNMTNVAFSGPVAFSNAQGWLVRQCSFGSGFTEDSSNCQYNSITDQRKAYVPTWTQSSGTQPSLGNGTLTGNYIRDGYTCFVSLRLVIGSTTTTGNNATSYNFSLPFPAHLSFDQRGMPAVVTIGSTTYFTSVQLGAGASVFQLGYNAQSVRDTFPAAWATGSTIDFTFVYSVR
jgi:hypothetical protein